MRAEVISIGDELTSGQSLDTNSQWLSERLGEVGVDVAFHTTVGDRLQDEPEMAARVVGVLEEVPLRMISQAASRRNITVVLRQADLPHAMERLHEEFFQ